MGRKITIINAEDVMNAENKLKELGSCGIMAIRLKAVIASYKHGIKKVCDVMDVSRDTIHKWTKHYLVSGVAALQNQAKPSRCKLTKQQQSCVMRWVDEDPCSTLKTLVARCEAELGVKIGKSSIQRILKSYGYSHITGRKKHNKSDTEAQAAFKNKLKNLSLESGMDVFFFDESRFGTHSKIGRAWFKTGVRTAIPYRMGYKWLYLYTAASSNGRNFTLIADTVDKASMQIFLDKFAQTLDKPVILVMDNAPWHSNLNSSNMINIVYLPSYSPELNPVERLWRYIKDHTIKNKIYESIEALEADVSKFLLSISQETIRSICHCNYISL